MHKVFCPHHLVRLTIGFVCILLCVGGAVLLDAQPAFANLIFLHDDANLFGNDTPAIEREASLLPYNVAIYTSFDPSTSPINLAKQTQQDANRAISKIIWIEIEFPSNTIAITSDKSVPLSTANYQTAQDAFSSTFASKTEITPEAWANNPPYWCNSLTPGDAPAFATAIAFQVDQCTEEQNAQIAKQNFYASVYTDAVNAAISNLGSTLGINMSSIQDTSTQDTQNTQTAQPFDASSSCFSGFTFFVLVILAFFIVTSLRSKSSKSVPQVHTPLANRWEAARAKPLFRDPIFSDASKSDKDAETWYTNNSGRTQSGEQHDRKIT